MVEGGADVEDPARAAGVRAVASSTLSAFRALISGLYARSAASAALTTGVENEVPPPTATCTAGHRDVDTAPEGRDVKLRPAA